MYGIRRLAAGAISFLALLVWASPALAVRPDTTGWQELQSGAGHFDVHYPSSISTADAQTVVGNLEKAYSVEVGDWGFAPPITNGSSKVDVYVTPLDANLGEASPDRVGPATSGYIEIDPSAVDNGETAAHELFHTLQYALDSRGAKFLKEGTAEWAGANVAGNTSWLLSYWGAPDQPLDCVDGSACAQQGNAYARWLFFDYLSEGYGPGIIKEILSQAALSDAGDDPAKDIQAIAAVLANHGTSLTRVFNDFTAANLSGGYGFPGLASSGSTPHSAWSTYTGATSMTLPTHTLAIDHLAANYVDFYSGDPRVSAAGCGASQLKISVDLPAGSSSVPSVKDAFGVKQLDVNGNTASATVPWTNCSGSVAGLALPNPGNLDGQRFVVHASMKVTPVKQHATSAPHIRVTFPKLAGAARRQQYLRFNVRSSGRGLLQALLKSGYVRGSYKLHKGVNKLRLRLPHTIKHGRRQFVLTAYSTTGRRGQTVRRHVLIRSAF